MTQSQRRRLTKVLSPLIEEVRQELKENTFLIKSHTSPMIVVRRKGKFFSLTQEHPEGTQNQIIINNDQLVQLTGITGS